ncbi:unnamed protein product [Rhodiola kirilowii]
MSSDSRPLRVFFFPFMAHGHLIPMVDIARLFSSQGVHSTIITTPLNANYISKTTSLSIKSKRYRFKLRKLGFPTAARISTCYLRTISSSNSSKQPIYFKNRSRTF